jgi:hypothetical protein
MSSPSRSALFSALYVKCPHTHTCQTFTGLLAEHVYIHVSQTMHGHAMCLTTFINIMSESEVTHTLHHQQPNLRKCHGACPHPRCLSASACPHVRMFVCPHVCMSACPHVCMSACLHVRMSACPHALKAFARYTFVRTKPARGGIRFNRSQEPLLESLCCSCSCSCRAPDCLLMSPRTSHSAFGVWPTLNRTNLCLYHEADVDVDTHAHACIHVGVDTHAHACIHVGVASCVFSFT